MRADGPGGGRGGTDADVPAGARRPEGGRGGRDADVPARAMQKPEASAKQGREAALQDGAGGRFHYSRQERLSRPGAPRRVPAARGGLLGNRPLLILLANVALVILLAVMLRALLPGPPHEGTLDGFSLQLQAAPRGEVVSVSLYVRRSAAEAAGGQRVFARFSLSVGGAESFDSAGLPRRRGQQVVLRGTLIGAGEPAGGGEAEVRAEVRIGNRTLLLRRKLPAPG